MAANDAEWDDIGCEEVAAAYVLLLVCIIYLWRYVFDVGKGGADDEKKGAAGGVIGAPTPAHGPEIKMDDTIGQIHERDDEPWDRLVRPRLDSQAFVGSLPSQSSWHDHRMSFLPEPSPPLHDPVALFAAPSATLPPSLGQVQMEPQHFDGEFEGDELGGSSVFLLPSSASLPLPLPPPLVSQATSRTQQQLAGHAHAASTGASTYLARKLEGAQRRAAARQRLRAHAPTQMDSLYRYT